MTILEMTPRRPHFFNATYNWLLENDLTPYLLVDATVSGVMVPAESIKNGEILLNLAPYAIGNYQMNNEKIEFDARFAGVSQHLVIPVAAMRALYAKENGVGLGFEDEPHYLNYQASKSSDDTQNTSKTDSDNLFTLVK